MPFEKFDRSRLRFLPISEREHDLDLSIMRDISAVPDFSDPGIDALAERIIAAREKRASAMLMMGGHGIRSGAAPYLIRLMEQGYIGHFALNGAGAIHDFELALIGHTCESVAKYISEGQFGLWQEDARYNDALAEGRARGLGFGEALGRYIEENDFPHKEYSLLAAGYRHQVPVTVHVGIGCDIVHEQANCDGAIAGELSYADFLIYTRAVENLEGGVFINAGSAVIGPEVYLKALAMARNVAHQENRKITRFTTAVFDLMDFSGDNIHRELPKTDARYYFRPWKTILARTVADGGESYYVRGDHRDTLPALAHAIWSRRNE